MVAIDKAWELVNKIWLNTGVEEQVAIRCALIAVDEILNEPDCSEAFWSDVKRELEKLKKIRDMSKYTKETTLAILEMIKADLTADIQTIDKAWEWKWDPAKIAGYSEEMIRVTLKKIERLIEGNK